MLFQVNSKKLNKNWTCSFLTSKVFRHTCMLFNFKTILYVDNLLSHCYYVRVLCSHVYYGQYTYLYRFYGQLPTCYKYFTMQEFFINTQNSFKFEKYTCMSKNLTCQKTTNSILI